MENKLHTLSQAIELIKEGRLLVIAGSDELLSQLPNGNWIGGSNPYLLDIDGGKLSADLLYLKDFSTLAEDSKVIIYDEASIDRITTDSYENGVIITVLPFFAPVHKAFGLKSPEFQNQYINPMIGWVSGTPWNDVGRVSPTVYHGIKRFTDKAVTLHLKLRENLVGRVEIINAYEQGDGDEITFEQDGFDNLECLVNKRKTNIYEYMQQRNTWSTPFVASYSGANINVGVLPDNENKRALFAAPVFKNTIYKLARKIDEDYVKVFSQELLRNKNSDIGYSCSCLFNYFNFGLNGKPIPGFTGVFTFGEVGYILLNVTFTYLIIEERR